MSIEEAVQQVVDIEVEEDEGDPFEGMNNAQIAEIYNKMKPEDCRLFRQFKSFHKLYYNPQGHDTPSHHLARGIVSQIFSDCQRGTPRQLLMLRRSYLQQSDLKNCVNSWGWPFWLNFRCTNHLRRHQSTHHLPSLQDFHWGKRRLDKWFSHSHP